MLSQSTSGPSRDTDRVVALFQQAVALHENDQLEDAEQLYRAVLRQDRRNMQALYNLCLIHYTRNHLVEALQVARRGLYQAPNWLEMLNLMALILKGLGKYADAIERFRRALAINPNISLVHFNLAQLFQEINLHEDALAHFRQASAIEPEAAVAHCNVGVALRTLGRIKEANVALEHAVALEPREPTYYRMLSYSWRFTTGDRYLVAMQSMAEDLASLNEQQQIDLHFALGKAYEDIGQHETGFRHFLAGNALKRQETPYDEPTGPEPCRTIQAGVHTGGDARAQWLRPSVAGAHLHCRYAAIRQHPDRTNPGKPPGRVWRRRAAGFRKRRRRSRSRTEQYAGGSRGQRSSAAW